MPDKSPKSDLDLRRKHNVDLLRRMKAGEPLARFDSSASWYPPRPTIEKDPDAVKRLYGAGDRVLHPKRSKAPLDVVAFPEAKVVVTGVPGRGGDGSED